MFAKLKKKIAEEAAIAPRPGGAARIPRSISKESITSVGADSGDDFASDGSSSREDLSSQLFRRNEQIRKLEVKLSASMRKLQEQNEAHQANRAKMAEGMALALEKKDQEWMEKLSHIEKEKKMLETQLQEMREQSLNLFQKRDEIDELEGFQQQEMAKVKHMLLKKEESLSKAEQELEARTRELIHTKEMLQEASTESSGLQKDLQELQERFLELEAQRDELLTAERNAENKITALELREQELQTVIQHLSVDLQNMTFEFAERSKLVQQLQEKVSSLEKKLERNLSGDEHIQELLKEKASLEQKLDETSQQMLTDRMHHANAVNQLETQVSCFFSPPLQIPNYFQPLYTQDLDEHLHLPENRVIEQNGEVTATDVIQLQKDNRELEQQVVEKNKMIKQLQQRMTELKKTLQKELKIRPDSEVPEVREKTNSEVPNASVTVTNNSDLNDSREINFEYLKHVVLKFMSCRESEAFHLIKAVSVLLNFSQEEENMLKETLEYKMSWFGSKPSPKGSIRPSISSPRTLWS
uniref:Golgin subfamily A member 1 n=1 Tax=Coturnix japonica TaxID=93934 RepID=A0A8C2TFX9_COTJA